MSKSVILAGQVLHGRDRLGSWLVRDIDGWSKTPPVKGESAERHGSDGEFDLPIQYGARSLIISGRVVCRSILDATTARDRLLGLLNGAARLQVTDGSGKTQWADVKRNGQVVAELTGPMVRFAIEAKAVNPRKFGDGSLFEVSGGQSVVVNHYGNYEAHPVVTITGDAPSGYTITGPGGKQFSCIAPLTTAQTHTVDFRDGLLRVNGYYWTGYMGRTDVWAVPPGQAIQVGLTVPAGSATAQISVLDTFI